MISFLVGCYLGLANLYIIQIVMFMRGLAGEGITVVCRDKMVMEVSKARIKFTLLNA